MKKMRIVGLISVVAMCAACGGIEPVWIDAETGKVTPIFGERPRKHGWRVIQIESNPFGATVEGLLTSPLTTPFLSTFKSDSPNFKKDLIVRTGLRRQTYPVRFYFDYESEAAARAGRPQKIFIDIDTRQCTTTARAGSEGTVRCPG